MGYDLRSSLRGFTKNWNRTELHIRKFKNLAIAGFSVENVDNSAQVPALQWINNWYYNKHHCDRSIYTGDAKQWQKTSRLVIPQWETFVMCKSFLGNYWKIAEKVCIISGTHPSIRLQLVEERLESGQSCQWKSVVQRMGYVTTPAYTPFPPNDRAHFNSMFVIHKLRSITDVQALVWMAW